LSIAPANDLRHPLPFVFIRGSKHTVDEEDSDDGVERADAAHA